MSAPQATGPQQGKGFLAHLALTPSGAERWTGPAAGDAHLAHGLVAAHAMVAAGATTDTGWRRVHAVHLSRLADGDPADPVEYRVDRLGDTDDAAHRLVHAWQGPLRLATVTVAFRTPRRDIGPQHQGEVPADDVPDPHSLRADTRGHPGAPIDVRYLDRTPDRAPTDPDASNRMWLRFTEEIPDRLLLHAAALVHAADTLLVEAVDHPGARDRRDLATGRPLEAHALDLVARFHRSFRADDWVLHTQCTPSLSDHRAFTTGTFHSSLGRLVATVSQETALQPRPGD